MCGTDRRGLTFGASGSVQWIFPLFCLRHECWNWHGDSKGERRGRDRGKDSQTWINSLSLDSKMMSERGLFLFTWPFNRGQWPFCQARATCCTDVTLDNVKKFLYASFLRKVLGYWYKFLTSNSYLPIIIKIAITPPPQLLLATGRAPLVVHYMSNRIKDDLQIFTWLVIFMLCLWSTYLASQQPEKCLWSVMKMRF